MAESGRTSPLTITRDGTPQGWVYIADGGITLRPLHRPRMLEGWQDVIRIYKKGGLDELVQLSASDDSCNNHQISLAVPIILFGPS